MQLRGCLGWTNHRALHRTQVHNVQTQELSDGVLRYGQRSMVVGVTDANKLTDEQLEELNRLRMTDVILKSKLAILELDLLLARNKEMRIRHALADVRAAQRMSKLLWG